MNNNALYQIATKALLFNGNKILVLITPDGCLDFPGGRVDESERNLTWHESLKREVREELGETIKINIEQTLFVSKRQYNKSDDIHYIAAIFFQCQYLSGTIEISDEHTSYQWLLPKEIINSPMKFISDDEKLQLQIMFG